MVRLKKSDIEEIIKKKKVIARRNTIYSLFFIISAILFLISLPEKKWFSAVNAIFTMFLSLIFYGKKRIEMQETKKGRTVMTEETNVLFGIYLLMWMTGLVLAVFSIFMDKYLPALIGLFVMFFCSLIAGLSQKRVNKK